MNAAEILERLERQGVAATSLCLDSRRVAPGDVFVAFKGQRGDGRAHIRQAVERGAAAVLYEAGEVAPIPVPHCAVENLDRLAGEVAHLVYGRPSERLWLAGVTGTNGKTSVSQWIAQALNALGAKCAVIGTLGNGFPGALAESPNTTPDAVALHRLLAQFVAQGASSCAMEVSSIGLDQGRINGAAFKVAVFTNLTRDHLEYHGDMDAYSAAKERLFDLPGLEAAVVNLDDPFGARLAQQLGGRIRTIGYTLAGNRRAADVLAAEDLVMTPTGLAFTVDRVRIEAPVVGRFNAANLLAVIGALLAGGAKLADIARALRRIAPPPGRMQAVGGAGEPLVVVDYAHTPDALEQALQALRETAAARGGKLVCIFGCGGDRDAGKRPLMGAAAERLADCVVLTSDNPRSEDPLAILAAIRSGMKGQPLIEADRAAAIRDAVAAAAASDVVLLAGKGHEPYQEVAGARQPFSDVAQALAALEARP
ncbi:MAG: UDP-N-acetylmuramoyl-L-alanyl-D-glutamate--2,6-diaminopimelate ligase [Rhodocyclaceae bacterium]|nr:UDP-N-acetylmuramoyl-L-alanyl-D-glutamate--2,6-diaminopimelate ligase [Rhodocyclaceae bacterium]